MRENVRYLLQEANDEDRNFLSLRGSRAEHTPEKSACSFVSNSQPQEAKFHTRGLE